jgi:hypothetical protein
MSTQLDKDDLAALLAGAPAEEVDQIHRLLHEWNTGPEGSFPVQLALLTRAQWRMAATLPRTLKESRKLIELHLAEYRRQSKIIADEFSCTANQQATELKAVGDTVSQAASKITGELDEAEAVAERVKTLMENAAGEWRGIKAVTNAQCRHLEEISNSLQDRFAWRVMLRSAAWFLLALGYGMVIGHYGWRH